MVLGIDPMYILLVMFAVILVLMIILSLVMRSMLQLLKGILHENKQYNTNFKLHFPGISATE